MTKNNRIHVYAHRHVFCDDDHLGLWHVPTATIYLRPEFEHLIDKVKAFFAMQHGLPLKVVVGAAGESFVQDKPLMDFPDDIKALMSPYLGELTPDVVAYAKEHFPRDEFERRYPGMQGKAEVAAAQPDETDTDAEPDPVPVKRPRKRGAALQSLEDQQPDED
jgi:hypothetical protein